MKYPTIRDLTMADKVDILNWISKWLASKCNGDKGHMCRIKIETIDNPGWNIEIDLRGTNLENLELPWRLREFSNGSWYGTMVGDKMFKAAGDPSKLKFLLERFRELVEGRYA